MHYWEQYLTEELLRDSYFTEHQILDMIEEDFPLRQHYLRLEGPVHKVHNETRAWYEYRWPIEER